ncbi:PsiF family protein [Rhodopseudomonas sp. B29]|uniref:PsiF family protein n=1 Tax=Rhodopseudomonas sp. B29 TaxID=95607 RepID=UPI00034D41CE|nr:PsiF family protein [Rhodopseudomonas sp. B29]
MITTRVATVCFASLLFTGVAFAQTPARAPTASGASKAATTTTTTAKPRTAQSLECSKEADAKGLHGKDRKKFRSECKKQASAKPKS